MKTEEEIQTLANDHWEYTKILIDLCVDLSEYCYTEAFKHGYKHGVTDANHIVLKNND